MKLHRYRKTKSQMNKPWPSNHSSPTCRSWEVLKQQFRAFHAPSHPACLSLSLCLESRVLPLALDLVYLAFKVWCGKTSGLSPYSCLINKTLWPWEFPGGLVVKILGFHCHGPGTMPGQETEILQAVWHRQKKKTCSPYCSVPHHSNVMTDVDN